MLPWLSAVCVFSRSYKAVRTTEQREESHSDEGPGQFRGLDTTDASDSELLVVRNEARQRQEERENGEGRGLGWEGERGLIVALIRIIAFCCLQQDPKHKFRLSAEYSIHVAHILPPLLKFNLKSPSSSSFFFPLLPVESQKMLVKYLGPGCVLQKLPDLGKWVWSWSWLGASPISGPGIGREHKVL